MCHDFLNDASFLKVSQGLAGQAAVDLETIDEHGDGDQAVGLDILVELVGDGLVEEDGVVGLVLDCSPCQSGAFPSKPVQMRRSFSTVVGVTSLTCVLFADLIRSAILGFLVCKRTLAL